MLRAGILGLALVAVACASTPKVRIEAPDVHVLRVAPLDSTGLEQRVRIDLRVSNPNNLALAFEGVRFDLEVNGAPLGRALSSDTILLPRLGQTEVSVVATTTLTDLVRQLVALRSGASLEYRVDGMLYLREPRSLTLPFRREGSLATDETG